MPIMPTFKDGPFSARNWRRAINILKRRRHIRGGPKIAVTQGPSGALISHAKDCFYADIQALGPDSEADYADERYWIKEQYVSNTSTDTTEAVTLGDKTSALHVTATNLAEITGGTHSVSAGEFIKAYIVRDAGSPKATRYIFNRLV